MMQILQKYFDQNHHSVISSNSLQSFTNRIHIKISTRLLTRGCQSWGCWFRIGLTGCDSVIASWTIRFSRGRWGCWNAIMTGGVRIGGSDTTGCRRGHHWTFIEAGLSPQFLQTIQVIQMRGLVRVSRICALVIFNGTFSQNTSMASIIFGFSLDGFQTMLNVVPIK